MYTQVINCLCKHSNDLSYINAIDCYVGNLHVSLTCMTSALADESATIMVDQC